MDIIGIRYQGTIISHLGKKGKSSSSKVPLVARRDMFGCLPTQHPWLEIPTILKPCGWKSMFWSTLLGTNISHQKSCLKMIFLFPRRDMLVPWRIPFADCLRGWPKSIAAGRPSAMFSAPFARRWQPRCWLMVRWSSQRPTSHMPRCPWGERG